VPVTLFRSLDGGPNVIALFVPIEQQRQGYGKLIMHFAINRILENGLTPGLDVNTANHSGIASYRM
jgi:hypothetical protein